MGCEFLQTVFGCHVEHLRRVTQPVRTLQVPIREAAMSSEFVLPIPKELWRLLHFLHLHGNDDPHLFSLESHPEEEEVIRECLDTGEEFPSNTTAQEVSAVLIEFLMVLHSPIVLVEWLDLFCLEYVENGRGKMDIVDRFVNSLTEASGNAVKAVFAMLRHLLSHSPSHHLSKERLSQIFLEALTHADQALAKHKVQDFESLHLLRFHRQGFLTLFFR